MSTTTKFNEGGTTSDSISRQFTPEKVLEAVIEMPKAKRPFSKMASVFAMSKNHGDTVTQEVRHGMMEVDNKITGLLDDTADLAVGLIYATDGTIYDVNEYVFDSSVTVTQAMIDAGSYSQAQLSEVIPNWEAAVDAAKAAVATDGKTIAEYAPNGIINGKSNYAAYQGTFLPLPEEGGVLNGFKAKSTLVSAKLTDHMIHSKYTTRSNDRDSRKGMLARHIVDLGDVLIQAKEGQLQASLQKVANERRLISTDEVDHIVNSDVDGMDVLTFETLEGLALDLQDAYVPMDTEVIKGIDLQDTMTVADSYVMFINRAALPTLTRMKGADETTNAWIEPKRYAAGAGELLEGEVGALEGLPFRFVVVENLQVEKGLGQLINNAGGTDDLASIATANSAHSTAGRYDVFSGLVVGADSFSITGFGYNSTKAIHVAPKRDVHNDLTGSVGAVVAEWSYAFLAYRPERIRKVSFSLQKQGKSPTAK